MVWGASDELLAVARRERVVCREAVRDHAHVVSGVAEPLQDIEVAAGVAEGRHVEEHHHEDLIGQLVVQEPVFIPLRGVSVSNSFRSTTNR